MGPKAFIAYSIVQPDAHMVYELGGLLEQLGYEVVYNYDHPEHPHAQHAFDEIATSMMFVGLITSAHGMKSTMTLYQYARSQGLPCVVLKESNIHLHGNFNGDRNIITFRRHMPENPIRFVEVWLSHNLR